MFKDQAGHIKEAVPSGFDLDELLRGTPLETQRVAESKPDVVPQPAGPSLFKLLLPLAIIALLAFLAWQFLFPKNTDQPADTGPSGGSIETTLDEGVQMPTQLAETYEEAKQAISKISDVASARSGAAPTESSERKAERAGSFVGKKLPSSARGAVAEVTRDNFEELGGLIRPILEYPEATETVRDVLTEILSKLKKFGDSA